MELTIGQEMRVLGRSTAKYHAIIAHIALRAAGVKTLEFPVFLRVFQKVVRHNSRIMADKPALTAERWLTGNQ